MRMDPSAASSARELVNEADERELTAIFRRERRSRPGLRGSRTASQVSSGTVSATATATRAS